MKQSTSAFKILFWLILFSIAMGYMESAVVIYLRELFYPNGFSFPLNIIPEKLAHVEIFREAATIIMLAGVSFLAGTNKLNRFAYYLIAFSIWDLFYYIFLFVFLGWPQSLFTWDILFLIPFPWTGPVIAPCLVCVGLIILASSILYFEKKGNVIILTRELFLLILGCLVMICSFMWDYFLIVREGSLRSLPDKEGLLRELETYIPTAFNWPLFLSGLFISSVGTFLFIKRNADRLKLKT
jgi:hypothetical protein